MTTKKGKDLVSIESLSKDEITYLLDMTEEFERHPNRKLLEGKVVATLFFEPSTRTRLSFETAANRLGARVIGFTDPKVTSSTKGETLNDTIQIIANYADVLIMRHYLEGAAKYASEVSPCPIINAGDGANQHPSQTMLDVYSIKKTQKTPRQLIHIPCGRLEIRAHGAFTAYGNEPLQSHIPFHFAAIAINAGRIQSFLQGKQHTVYRDL